MHNVYKVIKSGNEWHVGVDRRDFGTKHDFIPLFFFMHVQILWQGQKAVLIFVEFEFFDISYSKFQSLVTFSIWSKFCVEIWLLCCDLICKWVTCRSGCKRFWKSALHILRVYYFHIVTLYCKQVNEKEQLQHVQYTLNIETKRESRLCIRSFSVLILRLLSLHL